MTAKQSAASVANTSFFLLIAENDALARTVPAFYRHIESAKGLLKAGKSADALAKQSTKEITVDKLATQKQLSVKMTNLTKLTWSFADDTQNESLAKQLKAFPKAFVNTRQHEIVTLCQDVLDKIKPHLKGLRDYAVTEDMTQEAQGLIDSFEVKVPATRSKAKEKKVGTSDRDEAFGKMSVVTTQKILTLAVAFKESSPTFYKKIVATLTPDATVLPPTQLKVLFKNASGKHALAATTVRTSHHETPQTPNEKGVVTLKFPKGGRYDVWMPIAGGEPILYKDVLVRKNKTTRLVIEI